MTNNKRLGIIGVIAVMLVAVVAFAGIKLNQPAYAFKLDVNPSIEIVSNRLDKVVQVNALNEDAKEMLKEFEIKDNDLEDTIEDIADLMVLSGYIRGGRDNIVMITVNDERANPDAVNKLNQAIAAYLENKQIEATILNQSLSKELYDNNTGSQMVAKKLNKIDDDLDLEVISKLNIKELIEIAEVRNINPELLFSRVLASRKTNQIAETKPSDYIGEEKAREIALGLVNGVIVEFELDDNDDDGDDNPEYEIEIVLDGYKYEIELDAYSGKVLEFEKDDYDYDNRKSSDATSTTKATNTPAPTQKSPISMDAAKQIALAKTGGGTIVEAEMDDDEFEFEIINGNYEYEVEMTLYGVITDFEKDDIDD